VDGIAGGGDRDQPRAHRPRRPGDLRCGLTPVRERDEKVGDLLLGRRTVEHRAERGFGFVLRQRTIDWGQGGHAGAFASMPQIFRKFASSSCPCSVAMLSGWNCTPWIGKSRWRKPITLDPSSPGVSL